MSYDNLVCVRFNHKWAANIIMLCLEIMGTYDEPTSIQIPPHNNTKERMQTISVFVQLFQTIE